ncbi:hypothetical protein N5E30_16865 [Pseudomonas chengduensis]|jgi:hypothetical protein|uniref:hypothetical protein n=1 Tax=Stutzerimonas nitrititolerans TaxID=2482751 RepID=UPI0024490068|nr:MULTISPECIES: hypothetical protein [Pseudomonadaceae]MDH0623065.1 hypothetical protein [Pseudomonas chengduensis]MDH1665175.1 hypothetical protein [Pseudomonas chengduensis]MDH1683244.1 hypothetical protein [Pseudomonas chengduensis]
MSSGNLYENSALAVQHQSANATGTRLLDLLELGDVVSIESGVLQISQANDRRQYLSPFCAEARPLMREILTLLPGTDAFEYIGCSTGFYGQKKAPGLTLQFRELVSRTDAYAIFNVCLTRQRNTKSGRQGQPLPKGHFRVSKKHAFFAFWESTPLPFPRRTAALHDYMGKLRGIVFTGQKGAEKAARLDAGSLRPLCISAAEIRAALMPDNARTAGGQQPDNSHTSYPDIHCAECQHWQALQPLIATDGFCHGKAVIRERGDRDACPPYQRAKRPQDQTTEEWLADYQRPSAESW